MIVAMFSYNLYIYLLKFLHCIVVVLYGNKLKSVRIATNTLTLWTITEAFIPTFPASIAIPPLIYFFQIPPTSDKIFLTILPY